MAIRSVQYTIPQAKAPEKPRNLKKIHSPGGIFPLGGKGGRKKGDLFCRGISCRIGRT
jgi:hypothetical protein